MLRLTEKHPNYGQVGLVYPPEQIKMVPWNDKDLFEQVEDPNIYTSIKVIINNEEFEYLTFDVHELLAIVMMYLEPANLKFLKQLTVTGKKNGVNDFLLGAGMFNLKGIYPFTGGVNWNGPNSFEYSLYIKK